MRARPTADRSPGVAAIEVHAVRKSYGGLRPLRVAHLSVAPAERVALGGFDAAAAEVFTNLLTGAALPDEGDIRLFGRSTREIADGADWLRSLDAFGIVSLRAVLLTGATIQQNLALPFTVEIETVPAEVREGVERLVDEVGLPREALSRTVGSAPSDTHARVHLARAVALDPQVLLLEHPTALVPPSGVAAFARDVARVAADRRITLIAMTEDDRFATTAAQRVLRLEVGTGGLVPRRAWWRRCVGR